MTTIRRPHQLNTTQRGYDGKHKALRKQWTPQVAAGQVICWRCRRQIRPGQAWDLGHHPTDRTRYAGPEHASCNRATARHTAAKRRKQQLPSAAALAWFNPSKH